jgi:N-acyl homoserine lactone hydrolase
MTRIIAIAAALIGLTLWFVTGRQRAEAPAGPRVYVFENGFIRGLDTMLFNLPRDQVREPDFVNTSYLIVHPQGTLQFESGGIPDSRFTGDGALVVDGVQSANKPLLPQLMAAGYRPADITYFVLSHYHADHTGNASAFAGATWITQKAERDFMFSDNPQGIIQPATYSALKNARTKILDNEDFDVFGDGTVRIISTPGHTQGHQVLLVRLPTRGPVLLAGDLYHYPEEREKGIVPTFEFNADQSRASRAKVETLLKQTGAELWIEHDMATHAALPKAPAYIE